MSSDVNAAVGEQLAERVAQPDRDWVTPEERLLLRFDRKLDPGEQAFMRRCIARRRRSAACRRRAVVCELLGMALTPCRVRYIG